jgi:polysaccharide pyruvyl transferase WcaK-like protein
LRERTEPRLIVVLANPGGSLNLGDALLYEVLLEVLRPRGTVLVHSDPQRRETRAARFVESLASHLGVLKVAARARFGDRASTTVVVPPGESLRKSMSSLPKVLAQLGYFGLLRRAGVRIVVLARSSYFDSAVNVVQERALAALATSYSLRDLSSVDRARGRGIGHAVWFPDLSWLSNRQELQGGSRERKPSVLLCFRAEKRPEATSALMERIGELLAQVQQIGLRDIVLVQHHRGDAEVARQIHQTYAATYRISHEERPLGVDDIEPTYGNATLVLTNLLHSLLVGLQSGASSLAVIPALREHKIRTQLIDMELLTSAVDLHTPVERKRVAHTLARARDTRATVQAYREKARLTARPLLDELFAW